MKVTAPKKLDGPVFVPSLADHVPDGIVAPGETIDVPAPLARGLADQGWTTARAPKRPAKNTEADPAPDDTEADPATDDPATAADPKGK